MDTFFIYGLYDSDFPDEFRYVGQTNSMVNRFAYHSRGGDIYGPSGFWKWGVRFWGRTVEMAIIDAVRGTRDDSRRAERHHLDRLYKAGCRLTNSAEYNKHLAGTGVTDRLVGCYLTALRAVQRGTKRKRCHPAAYEPLFYTTTAIDSLESEFPAMALWGKTDSFRQRFRELFDQRLLRRSLA